LTSWNQENELIMYLLACLCTSVLDKENSATPIRRSTRCKKLFSPDFKGMAGGKTEKCKIGASGGVYKGTQTMKNAPKSAW
jgi:hypothetical protein